MNIGATLDRAIEQRVRDSFDQQGLMALLGAQMVGVTVGQVVIRLPFRAEVTQHHGYFHAGGTSAIADTAGGYAAYTMFPDDSSVLTVEFKLNLLNPGQGDYLEAIGRVVKPGRTLTVCQLDVWGVFDDRRIHVATGVQTLIRVQSR
ncbi:PaaI family thioesterase [Paracoccus sp. 11-3]|uniref:Medium/long-chain acyl-CoA thioesterase YigI n=1 Tax=Paracoccus amoyensis TaxID=2760093 RepID=A0A926G946_9RHOB|nr:PaaI family thioesterase [Paracoccus amoyensis]MBC9248143.1 PaaI family thioesterase [Paracoccus amoyensis]